MTPSDADIISGCPQSWCVLYFAYQQDRPLQKGGEREGDSEGGLPQNASLLREIRGKCNRARKGKAKEGRSWKIQECPSPIEEVSAHERRKTDISFQIEINPEVWDISDRQFQFANLWIAPLGRRLSIGTLDSQVRINLLTQESLKCSTIVKSRNLSVTLTELIGKYHF